MSLAAGTTSTPIAIGLIVGVVAFLAWAAAAVRRERAELEAPTAAVPEAASAPAPIASPTPVRAVVRPHYVVTAPDDDAVRVAMLLRVRPPVPLPVPVPAPAADAPERVAAASLPRSA